MMKILRELSSFFSTSHEIQLNPGEPSAWLSGLFPVTLFDFWNSKKNWIEVNQPNLGPMMQNTIDAAKKVSIEERRIAKNKQEETKKY